MSICNDIRLGYSICDYKTLHNVQKLILVNRADVDLFNIVSNNNLNHISFTLKTNKSGILFEYSDQSNIVASSFNMSRQGRRDFYNHSVTMFQQGVTELDIARLKQLNKADYFGAVLFNTGEVHILGFNYGLESQGFDYTSEGDITLSSRDLEYDMPYLFVSLNRTPEEDFNDLFVNNELAQLGDFNDDFNNDFNTTV